MRNFFSSRYFYAFAISVILSVSFLHAQTIDVVSFGAIPNSFADATVSVQKAIEASRKQPHAVINFPKGRYDFWPDRAAETHYYISNTSSELEFPLKKQRGGLLLKGMKNLKGKMKKEPGSQ